ncbi:MAG: hypothetical protein ISN29_08780 [Gammaproteobacteria bacterium AqS3]|nr:hypothetical protein [Gammaproteobacteria bacterium AqS3]
MSPSRSFRLALLLVFCAVTRAAAQGDSGLPLSIENLLAPSGGSEISYSIRHIAFGNETADRLSAELGYSYGLTEDIEVGLSLDASHTDDRNADPRRGGECIYAPTLGRYLGPRCRDEKDTTTRLGTLRAQISRGLSPENETPGAFGWVGFDLLENRSAEGEDFRRGRGAFNAGLSLYRTYDPIVLRIAFGYAHIPPEHIRNAGRFDRGDTISISPSVLFAVNNIVSISATSDIQVTFSDTLDRQDRYSYRRTVVTAGIGVSLSLRDRTTVYISGSTFASAGGGASFGVFVRHRPRRDDLLADDSESTESEQGTWWGRHRVKVWGIASGLIAASRVRDARR